jgi:hypothetical protein
MKTFGLSDLSKAAQVYIFTKASQVAHWTSPTEKGEGSTMMMEWITFALTPEQWASDIKAILGPLPEWLQQELNALAKSHKCRCPMRQLMVGGCVCGGM